MNIRSDKDSLSLIFPHCEHRLDDGKNR